MRRGTKSTHWLGNLILLLCSLAAMLLLCELVVFRYILKPDDVIHNVSIDGAYVEKHVGDLARDADLSKFIL